MFTFNNNTIQLMGSCGNNIQQACDYFIKQGKLTALHINGKPGSGKTSILNYCTNLLGLTRVQHSNINTVVISNYDEAGEQSQDTILTLLNRLIVIMSKMNEAELFSFRTNAWFVSEMKVLCHYEPLLNDILKYDDTNSYVNQNSDIKEQLITEFLDLIQLYCSYVGPIVIAIDNVDTLSKQDKAFYLKIPKKTKKNICLVITDSEVSFNLPDFETFNVTIETITQNIISKMVGDSFAFEPNQVNELASMLLEKYHVTTPKQVRDIIDNIIEIHKLSCQHNERYNMDDNSDDNKIQYSDLLDIMNNYYIQSRDLISMPNFASESRDKLSDIEKNILYLCAILGPYIKLQHLGEIYLHCFGTELPSNIDYARLELEKHITTVKHLNLVTYQHAKSYLKRYHKYSQLRKKVQLALSQCNAIQQHIRTLYMCRRQQPKIMSMLIQITILELYRFNVSETKDIEQVLSGSGERKSIGSNEKIEKITNLGDEHIEIIINSYNDLISYYSSKQDMNTALKHCCNIAKFLNLYHTPEYVVNIEGIDIARMISNQDLLKTIVRPFGRIDKSLHDVIINILINMCMLSYFTEKYWLLRKYIFQAYQLLNPESKYRIVVEAYVALILTQAAEVRLFNYTEFNILNSIRDQEKNHTDALRYKQLRTAVSILVKNITKRLLSDEQAQMPVPEQALTWSLIGAIAGNFSIPYSDSHRYLMHAYTKGMEQRDIFKAILAYGNAILLEFCAGLPIKRLRVNCIKFIKICNTYGLELPKPIIQGFLIFAEHIMEIKRVEIEPIPDTEGPNRFFINFTRLLILFYDQNYKDCVILCQAIRRNNLNCMSNNIRSGYNISKDFLLLETVALLRYLETEENERTKERIKLIKITVMAFIIYAEDFPENFLYRTKFLIAEVYRSSFWKRVFKHQKQLSDSELIQSYEEALALSIDQGNQFYSYIILDSLWELRLDMLQSTENQLDRHLEAMTGRKNAPILIRNASTNTQRYETNAETSYDANQDTTDYIKCVNKLVNCTHSNLIMYFLYDREHQLSTSKILFCKNNIFVPVRKAISSNDTKRSWWSEDAIKRAMKTQQVIHDNSTSKNEHNLFSRNKNIKSFIAVPIANSNDDQLAVLYLQSDQKKLQKDDVNINMFKNYVNSCHAAIIDDPVVLDFILISNSGSFTKVMEFDSGYQPTLFNPPAKTTQPDDQAAPNFV